MLHRRTLTAALVAVIAASATLVWGLSSAAAASHADALESHDAVTEPVDPLATGSTSTWCPIPPRATPVPSHAATGTADSLWLLEGQSTLGDTAASLQCPGVPVPSSANALP
ncbi:MAG: hypothetical protein V4813_10020 [Gemmatimonadota bacterium]